MRVIKPHLENKSLISLTSLTSFQRSLTSDFDIFKENVSASVTNKSKTNLNKPSVCQATKTTFLSGQDLLF